MFRSAKRISPKELERAENALAAANLRLGMNDREAIADRTFAELKIGKIKSLQKNRVSRFGLFQ
jgi:hypothetical protein